MQTDGTTTTGEREIDPEQADIVRRIFRDYVAGQSSRKIAGRLNAEGVSGPWPHPVQNVPQNRSCHEQGRSPRGNVIIRDGAVSQR